MMVWDETFFIKPITGQHGQVLQKYDKNNFDIPPDDA